MGKPVSIRITGKDDSKQAFSSAHGSINSLKTTISSMGAGMKAVWNMAAINQAAELIGKVTAVVKDLVDSYGKQEQAERKLGLTVSQNSSMTASAMDRLKKSAADFQRQSIFGDEQVIEMQSYLAGLDMTEKQINEIIQSSLDLASTGMVSLEQSVKGMAQSITAGSLGSLAEVVPTLKQFTAEELMAGKAVDFVGSKYKGMAKSIAESSTGMLQQFTNTFGDFKERIGEQLAPAFAGIVKTLGDQLPKFEKALQPVLGIFKDMGPLISAVLDLAGNVLVVLQPVFDFIGWAAGGIASLAADAVRAVSGIVIATKSYEETLDSANRKLELSAEEGRYLADGLQRAASEGVDMNEQVARLSEITEVSKEKIEKFAYYMGIAEVGAGKIEADTKKTAENLKYQAEQQKNILEMYGLIKNENGLIVKNITKMVEPTDKATEAYTEWVKKGNEIKENVLQQIANMKRQNELLKIELTDTEKINQYENQRLQLVQSIIALENLGVTAGETDNRYKALMDALREIAQLTKDIASSSSEQALSVLEPIEDAIRLKMFEMGLNGEQINAAKQLELLEEKRKNIISKIVELEKEQMASNDENKIKEIEDQQQELINAQKQTEQSIQDAKKAVAASHTIWSNLADVLKSMATKIADFSIDFTNSAISYFSNLITSSEGFSSVMESINTTAKELMSVVIEPLISAIRPLLDMFLQIVAIVSQALVPIFEMLGLFIQNTMPIWQSLMDIVFLVMEIFQILAPPIFMIAELFAQFLYPVLKIITPLLEVLKILLVALMPIIEFLAKVLDAVSRPFEFLADVIIFVVKTFQTLAYNLGAFMNNLNPFNKHQNFQAMPTFSSDAFSRPLISIGGYASELGLDGLAGNNSTIQTISGSTTNVSRAPDIYVYNYFQGPVVGSGGMSEVGGFIVGAIQEYVGAGGTVSFEGA